MPSHAMGPPPLRRLSAVLFALTGLPMPVASAADASGPAFPAWMNGGSAFVYERADEHSPKVGLLRSGDVVSVTRCDPSCDAPGAWAWLGSDGAVRLSLLARSPQVDRHPELSASDRYIYGTVRVAGTPVRRDPSATSAIVHRLKAGRVLAFEVQEVGETPEWLPCSRGGFVSAAAIRLATPSIFKGVHDPTEVTAFTLRKTLMTPLPGQAGAPVSVERHTAWAVTAVDPGLVWTSTGTFRRGDVRLAVARPRPRGIPAGARWVGVEVGEQTLLAYEGDKPVFATLVSSGRSGHRTGLGSFSVFLKTIHDPMIGREQTPYEVDEVPFTMFFNRGDALHGAFWHDRFGNAVSHGCVNLSVDDAHWLFDWAPPKLPAGWHAVIPGPTHAETLFVNVGQARALRHWRAPAAEAPTAAPSVAVATIPAVPAPAAAPSLAPRPAAPVIVAPVIVAPVLTVPAVAPPGSSSK